MAKPLVVVKFNDGTTLPYDDGVGPRVDSLGLGHWGDPGGLVAHFPGVDLKRLFRSLSEAEIDNLLNRAAIKSPGAKIPELKTYFMIDYDEHLYNPEDIVHEVGDWSGVENAYVDRPAPDPSPPVADDPMTAYQGYLDAAPAGVDARSAWELPGGRGEGLRLIDVERGWKLDHIDLAASKISLFSGVLVPGSKPHGTSVLGIICALENGVGVVGLAPRAGRVDVISYFNGKDEIVADAIARAASALAAGDILLVEAVSYADFQAGLDGPTEMDQADFEAIQVATLAGIVVIEPAGNGDRATQSVNLDTYIDPIKKNFLRRQPSSPAFKDSGAIMVAAARASVPHARMPWSNHGSRVDCYAWGEGVASSSSSKSTAGSDQDDYTTSFGGSSAAAAIIAGVALVVQSLAKTYRGMPFYPTQLREILSDPQWGTLPASPDIGRIGVMPDLRRIAAGVLHLPAPAQTPAPGQPPPIAAVPAGAGDERAFVEFLLGLILGITLGLFLGIVLGLIL